MKKTIHLALVLFFIFINLNDVKAVWENRVFKENIKTVYCHRADDKLEPPIIELNTAEELMLEFDDLNNEQSVYFYKVVHCNWKWETSDLTEHDYIDGFGTNEVYNAEFSINTRQEYTHFWLVLPNYDLQFKLSGNYIIMVFENNNPDELVLTQRVMVFENEVSMSIKVKATGVVSDREIKQEIDFTVNTGRLKLFNVFEEIHAVVLQNMRWDNAITNLQPKFLNGSQLIYDFEKENSFDGGNEYRHFDIKDLAYQSGEIAMILKDSMLVRVFLHPDEKKTFKRYTTWEDLNGHFLIKNDFALDSDLESDYVWVYFTLPFDFPLQNADIYLGGQFTGYNYNKDNLMTFDFEKRAFKGKMLLKQGYYNYVYMLVDKNRNVGHMGYIEGNHFETNNYYHIFIYYQDNNKYYDRLVGVGYRVSHL
jgi:hypothetical protein